MKNLKEEWTDLERRMNRFSGYNASIVKVKDFRLEV